MTIDFVRNTAIIKIKITIGCNRAIRYFRGRLGKGEGYKNERILSVLWDNESNIFCIYVFL